MGATLMWINLIKPTCRLTAAALVGLALIAAGPAHAKKDEATPYTYGPPPDWAEFKQLAEAAVRARLVDPDSAKFEWPNGYHKGLYNTKLR